MDDLDPKDKTTQAQVLVGRFLWYWGALEATINNCIGKLLGLDDPQMYIVGKNTQFRDKINILRTAATIATPNSAKLADLMAVAAELYIDRNVVAHDMFDVSEDGTGVQFYSVKARDKLRFPVVVWTPGEFAAKYSAIARLTMELDKEVKSGITIKRLADALAHWPKNALHALSPRGGLFPPPPETPNSQTTNPQTDGETPEADPPSMGPWRDK